MKDYQQRVIEEQSQLQERFDKLDAFGRTEVFDNLPSAEQGRLNRQHSIMEDYLQVLSERIEAFND